MKLAVLKRLGTNTRIAHPRLLPAARALPVLALLFCLPTFALAGMPSIGLSEIAALRLQTISFFLVGLLVSAVVIQWLWNWIGRDFDFLPRLSFSKACGIVVLWGLLFVIVLTMISGARELMTPGAWEQNGLTYKLRDGEPVVDPPAGVDAPAGDDSVARLRQMERLSEALMQYARSHHGQFPDSRDEPSIEPQRWLVPGSSGMRYVYLGGQTGLDRDVPLAVEPNVFADELFVVSTQGTVTQLAYSELSGKISETMQP